MVRDGNNKVVSLPEILPPQSEDGKVNIPLLDAFAQGFQLAFLAESIRKNRRNYGSGSTLKLPKLVHLPIGLSHSVPNPTPPWS